MQHVQQVPSPRRHAQQQLQAPSPQQVNAAASNRRQQQQQQPGGQANRTIPGMGGHLLKRRERRVPGDAEAPEAATDPDFNFEERLNDFNKEAEFSKIEVKETKVRPTDCDSLLGISTRARI